MSYPITQKEKELIEKYNVDITDINVKYPYCHVDRYGGDNTGVKCSSNSIQIAVDYNEYLGNNSLGVRPITFSGGTYLITKTVLIKGNKNECKDHIAVTLKGVDCKLNGGNFGTSTCLNLKIPHSEGKTYNTAFAINVKYENGNDLDKIVFSEGVSNDSGFINLPQMSNIKFENFSVKCLDDNLNNIFIKGYRFRSTLTNIFSQNLYRTIYQPSSDVNGNNNYCDFSVIENISLSEIKYIGIEVSGFDNSCIKNVIEHRIKPTAEGVIRINGGCGIKLERLQHAYHFIDGTTTPRQDGSGNAGLNYYLLLNNTSSVNVECMYLERWLKDFVIRLYNTTTTSITNVTEKYLGNGFIKATGYCYGLVLKNIDRNINKTVNYSDIHIYDCSEVKSFKVKNFINRKYYNEEISLSTNNLNNLTKLDNKNEFYMPSLYFLNSHAYDLDLEKVKLNVLYDGDKWIIRDMYRNDLTSKFTIEFNGRLYIKNKEHANKNCIIESAETVRTGSTQTHRAELFMQNGEKSISFFDRLTNGVVQTADTSMNCFVTFNLISRNF